MRPRASSAGILHRSSRRKLRRVSCVQFYTSKHSSVRIFGSREARARCSGWVEKANRRPDRPTRHPSLLIWKLTILDENSWNCSALLIWKVTIFDENLWKSVKLRPTPFLKTDTFRRKFVKIGEIEAPSFFENWPISTKICENLWNSGALLFWKLASFDENWWKSVKLRRTPYFKTGQFRRKFVKIGEIEKHSLF
jgi:hypothetical protein